ncbi:hypothetical protein [Archangium sp.]|uniref:hypothetical protein n=1 Tax=Archangium sp. TaxID=1872627 RepID=UPI00286D5BF5|nr:hypothetical protein [Archangium sp.]
MADTGFFKGWLGSFKLIRRYATRKQAPGAEDVGRVYEAYNLLTDNPALLVLPSESAPVESQEEWDVRVRAQALPPFFMLEVRKGPPSGRLSQLSGILRLLATAIERLENGEEARAHLTRLPMGSLESLRHRAGRAWRWIRVSRWRTVSACLLMFLSLRLVVHRVEMEVYGMNWDMSPRVVTPEELAVRPARVRRAPGLVDMANTRGATPIAYPLPSEPFDDQAKTPCYPKQGEVEINGGCWVTLEKRPPCFDIQAEYKGKCYMPVSARSRRREPQSIRR